MSDTKVSLKFIGYEKEGDHVNYKIIVKDSNNETWQVFARYSTLRQIYRELRDNFSADKLPDFPPKKYFGSMSENFITQRQKALENFFNNLLKKYRYEELDALKTYIQDHKQSLKKNEKPVNPPINPNPIPVGTQPASPGIKVDKDKLINLEKVVANFKNEFFDLNDTLNPLDEEELRKRKAMYNFKFDVGLPKSAYELPLGTESNLISIQDKTLANQDSVCPLISITLDEIAKGIREINILNGQSIVVNLD